MATFAAFANIAEVVDLTNIGTLFAFVLVSAGVIVLRRQEPDRVRPFRAPLVPLTPIISIVTCLYLMLQLPRLTWIRFGRLAAAGSGDLLPLRDPAQPAGEAGGGRRKRDARLGARTSRQPERARDTRPPGCPSAEGGLLAELASSASRSGCVGRQQPAGDGHAEPAELRSIFGSRQMASWESSRAA